MNKYILLLFISIQVLLPTSCNTDSPSLYMHREYDFVIGAALNTFETHFFIQPNIKNTFREELELNGIQPEQISSVSAGRGLFTPIFDEFDYDVIREVSIWLVSVENPSTRKEIYYREQVPYNQNNELRLLSGLADLKDFLLEEDYYNLEIQLKFRNFVPFNFDNRFTYSFAIFTN